MDKTWTIINVNVQARRLLWLIKSLLLLFFFFCIFLSLCYWTCRRIIELILRLCRRRKAKEAYSYIRFNNLWDYWKAEHFHRTTHINEKQTIYFFGSRQISWGIPISRSVCDIGISKPWEIKQEFVPRIKSGKEIERHRARVDTKPPRSCCNEFGVTYTTSELVP